jgi:arabinofuranosyltransferase
LIYYGALVPNTALAKLSTGIPKVELVQQGLHYWWATLLFDPVTPVALALGTTLLALTYGTAGRVMAAGIVLYSLFVIQAGGDFMSGRFLTPTLTWALIGVAGLNATSPQLLRWVVPLGAAAVIGGLFAPPSPPLLSGPRFGAVASAVFDHFGVTDERRFYYPTTGLLRRLGYGGRLPDNAWEKSGKAVRARASERQVIQASNVGMFGYWAGPNVHVVDRNALGDALLSRLPAKTPWRIGHFTRVVPDGYMETWEAGTNALVDPRLHRFYDELSVVTQGPIWTTERFRLVALLALRRIQPLAP